MKKQMERVREGERDEEKEEGELKKLLHFAASCQRLIATSCRRLDVKTEPKKETATRVA